MTGLKVVCSGASRAGVHATSLVAFVIESIFTEQVSRYIFGMVWGGGKVAEPKDGSYQRGRSRVGGVGGWAEAGAGGTEAGAGTEVKMDGGEVPIEVAIVPWEK
jgi:hypothetical protein